MKTLNTIQALSLALLLGSGPAAAQESDDARDAEVRAAYEAAVETARAEQTKAEAAVERAQAEMARAELEKERASTEEERAAMRQELSRVHEDLRRASREVARVHREIAREAREIAFAPHASLPNVGDKAVIGVVLGGSKDKGVAVLGVSPDGPSDRAGIREGDLIVAMMGKELAGDAELDPRAVLNEVMQDVKIGDELTITVERDGERIEHVVTAEKREPFAWQSFLRLPSVPSAPAVPGAPAAPGAPNAPIVIEHIEIPEIDTEVLREKMVRLREDLGHSRVVVETRRDSESGGEVDSYEYYFETFSELGDEALQEANIWFGLPVTRGLKLAEMDAGLAAYFKADGGVLVLEAREDNDLQLRSGDVITQIGEKSVSKPADVMRALRDWEPGASIEIHIKRERRDQTLDVVLPEQQVGFELMPFSEYSYSISRP